MAKTTPLSLETNLVSFLRHLSEQMLSASVGNQPDDIEETVSTYFTTFRYGLPKLKRDTLDKVLAAWRVRQSRPTVLQSIDDSKSDLAKSKAVADVCDRIVKSLKSGRSRTRPHVDLPKEISLSGSVLTVDGVSFPLRNDNQRLFLKELIANINEPVSSHVFDHKYAIRPDKVFATLEPKLQALIDKPERGHFGYILMCGQSTGTSEH